MDIRTYTGSAGFIQMKASFKKNRKHYLQEALGLGIFMISACFFSAMLFSEKSTWYHAIPGVMTKNILMGIFMGSTALFIFYSPWTAPSGSHINPAVTLTFLRLDKMCRYDALFFIIFQIIGGTAAVFIMQLMMGNVLTASPINSAVTVPGKYGASAALVTELMIAFVTMTMVLFTSHSSKLKKYTRIFSGCLVCAWVIFAGPVSGFGMNPARSFASALPANTWTAFWVYLIIPFAGMLLAAEVFLFAQRRKANSRGRKFVRTVSKSKELLEPLEFLL
ncbi:MAG TPA: aquaporin [Chitinophagaceae bacterium]|nr:aquaporin [Chitinophagaceae bacterium]